MTCNHRSISYKSRFENYPQKALFADYSLHHREDCKLTWQTEKNIKERNITVTISYFSSAKKGTLE